MWSSCLLILLSTRSRVRSREHSKFISIVDIEILGGLYNAITSLLPATADIRGFFLSFLCLIIATSIQVTN